METAFIITDKNKMPYAVVSILKGGTEFHPLSENAKTWSGWMNDEYAVRQVSKGQLTATLDNSMSVEGPIAYARNNKLRLDELIAKAKKIPVVEQIEGKKSVDELHVISILDAQLHQLDDSEWHNAIQFKAGAFVADSNKASMNFEVKRTRALWDAGLSIPGTNRRGGWRCPPGMAFGGQITDRFGRNCGAGLARRLANGLQNVGERIENADDAKRGKRVARRNAAMGRRLAGAGAIERGAGRIADALETNLPKAPAGRVVGAPVRKIRGAGVVERGAGRLADALETKPPKVRGAGRIERGAGRLADALETKPPKRARIGRIERGAGRLADALETRPPKVKPKRTIVGEADKKPIRDNAVRRGLRDIAPDLMAYAEGAEAGVRGRRNPVYEGTPEKLPSGGVRKPKAPRAAAATAKPRKPRVAPVAPKAPKAPKEPKFNERKALTEALDTDTLSTLIDDERISEELKNAIITYTTLRGLDLPEAIINAAKATLASFGKGSKGGTSGPRQTFGVEVNGVVYATLTSAIAAQGIEKIITGENKSDDADIAWRTIRPRLIKDGIANYNDATYTKVDSPVAATVEA